MFLNIEKIKNQIKKLSKKEIYRFLNKNLAIYTPEEQAAIKQLIAKEIKNREGGIWDEKTVDIDPLISGNIIIYIIFEKSWVLVLSTPEETKDLKNPLRRLNFFAQKQKLSDNYERVNPEINPNEALIYTNIPNNILQKITKAKHGIMMLQRFTIKASQYKENNFYRNLAKSSWNTPEIEFTSQFWPNLYKEIIKTCYGGKNV